MSGKPVLEERDGELSMRLLRQGKKKYLLHILYRDATYTSWRSEETPLRFGAVKAIDAAKAYWELAKIRRK